MAPFKKIPLPDDFVNYLMQFPESGMGYQVVRVILKDGRELNHMKVLNSSFLLAETSEFILPEQILRIEVEQ